MGTTVMPVYSNADLVFNTRLEKIPLFTTTPIIGAGTSNQGLRRAAARSALLRLPFTQPSAPYNKPPKNESHSHGGGSSGGYPAPAYASPFASLVPSTFPPRTNPNLVACFQMHERTFKLLKNSTTLSHIIKIKIKSLQQTNRT
ncbi:hypothetical protein JHK82_015999 [Glycine max]|nr:hypothetical protein JHK82_015999 [Glycine max]